MESVSLSSSTLPLLSSTPSSSSSGNRNSSVSAGLIGRRRLTCRPLRRNSGRGNARVFAVARGGDFEREWGCGGRMADESMIVLRKRIHEMKMMERNYEPPRDWMDWEKRLYTCYDERVCAFVGVLQSLLMNTRPSVALGMVAFTAMSVPLSTALILSRAVEVATGALSAIH